jgi:ribosomal-protein-alanine N-acetyltransferase
MNEPLPLLMGRRVLLREPRADDAEAVFLYSSDPEVTRFLAFETPADLDETLAFLARCLEFRRQDREYVFIIADVKGDRPLGVTGLRHIELPMRTAQIGSWVARAHWGSGANAEAKRLLLNYAFGSLGLHRVEARIAIDNLRSRRAFEKLGGVREGTLRESFFKDGVFYDQDLFAILSQDWKSSSNGSRPPNPKSRA